ncbi:MAG: helix-turn-helix domain-containing protein [Desulfobacteraceae bacterium]
MITETQRLPKYAHPDIIEKFRLIPGRNKCGPRSYEILPDGYFDLVFLLSRSGCRTLLAGPYTGRTKVSIGCYELFIIRFKSGRLPGIIDIKPSEVIDTMVELPRVLGHSPETVCEMLLEKKAFAEKQEFMEGLIGKANLSYTGQDRVYETAVLLIDSEGGQIQVSKLADALGVKERTLERKFAASLGISPKKFIRLVRFQKVVEKLKSGHTAGMLTDTAYEFGYTDQSHFIKDFKSFSGVSPGEFSSL